MRRHRVAEDRKKRLGGLGRERLQRGQPVFPLFGRALGAGGKPTRAGVEEAPPAAAAAAHETTACCVDMRRGPVGARATANDAPLQLQRVTDAGEKGETA